MEDTFTFTQSELEEAFKKWNACYLEKKSDFEEINDQTHIGQAKDLIKFLQEV